MIGSFLSRAALTVATVSSVGACARLADRPEDLLKNPSLHVMVNDSVVGPESGTFELEARLYKIDPELDLSPSTADRWVTDALVEAFAPHGFTLRDDSSSAPPDLLVSVAIALNASLSADELHDAYSDRFAISFDGLPEEAPAEYRQGVLLIDIVQPSSGQLLWRGAIQAELRRSKSTEERRRTTFTAVASLLEQFPRPTVAVE